MARRHDNPLSEFISAQDDFDSHGVSIDDPFQLATLDDGGAIVLIGNPAGLACANTDGSFRWQFQPSPDLIAIPGSLWTTGPMTGDVPFARIDNTSPSQEQYITWHSRSTGSVTATYKIPGKSVQLYGNGPEGDAIVIGGGVPVGQAARITKAGTIIWSQASTLPEVTPGYTNPLFQFPRPLSISDGKVWAPVSKARAGNTVRVLDWATGAIVQQTDIGGVSSTLMVQQSSGVIYAIGVDANLNTIIARGTLASGQTGFVTLNAQTICALPNGGCAWAGVDPSIPQNDQTVIGAIDVNLNQIWRRRWRKDLIFPQGALVKEDGIGGLWAVYAPTRSQGTILLQSP